MKKTAILFALLTLSVCSLSCKEDCKEEIKPEVPLSQSIANTTWKAISSVSPKDTVFVVIEFTDYGIARLAYRTSNNHVYAGLEENVYTYEYPKLNIVNQFGNNPGFINTKNQLEFGGWTFNRK